MLLPKESDFREEAQARNTALGFRPVFLLSVFAIYVVGEHPQQHGMGRMRETVNIPESLSP
jgi:hypothetical protein